MKGYHVTQLLNQYGEKNPTDASRFPVHYQPSKLKPTASPVKKNESNVTFSRYIIRPGPGNVLRIHPVQLGVLVANCTNPLASSMWKVRFGLPPSIQLLRRHSRVGQLGQWACLLIMHPLIGGGCITLDGHIACQRLPASSFPQRPSDSRQGQHSEWHPYPHAD